jgi:DNA adenine methylase
MRYVGSKARIARQIRDVILGCKGSRGIYVEPFLGGANSFNIIAPHFEVSVGVELNASVAMMWQAVGEGWIPPVDVSEELYVDMRNAGPSALRGFVGAGCSFGGKWFGGYARGGYNADGTPRNYPGESSRAVLKKADVISKSVIVSGSYEMLSISANCVVYCDPPYRGTLGYGSQVFNHDMFWKICDKWSDVGALVLVSEYVAPVEWECVGSWPIVQSVSSVEHRNSVVERLFRRKGC